MIDIGLISIVSIRVTVVLLESQEDTINEMVEIATGLFDANSPTFKDFLKYSLIAGGGLVGLGLLWEIYYNVSKKKKNKLEGKLCNSTTMRAVLSIVFLKQCSLISLSLIFSDFRSIHS